MPSDPIAVSALRERLQRLVRRHGVADDVAEVSRIPQGISSLTYLADLVTGARTMPVVVKVAPPGRAPRANRDVLRQAGVLRALRDASAAPPVPEVVLTDAGGATEPPLFAMTRLDGDGIDPSWPKDPELPADVVLARMLAMTRALADLHAVPPDGILADEPRLDLMDEVDRWTAVFATVDPGLSSLADRCRARLQRTAPPPRPVALNHGDYRFGNVLFTGVEVSGLIDWEIAAVEDARFDLANLVLYGGPHSPLKLRAAAPSVPREPILAAYEERSEARVRDFSWFEVALRYKCTAALALLVKNSRKRSEPDPLLEEVAERLPDFLRGALD